MFRVDELAVDGDVEYARAATDELGLDAEGVLDPGRQTGGLRQEVSSAAVGDLDTHTVRIPQPCGAAERAGYALPGSEMRMQGDVDSAGVYYLSVEEFEARSQPKASAAAAESLTTEEWVRTSPSM